MHNKTNSFDILYAKKQNQKASWLQKLIPETCWVFKNKKISTVIKYACLYTGLSYKLLIKTHLTASDLCWYLIISVFSSSTVFPEDSHEISICNYVHYAVCLSHVNYLNPEQILWWAVKTESLFSYSGTWPVVGRCHWEFTQSQCCFVWVFSSGRQKCNMLCLLLYSCDAWWWSSVCKCSL